MSFAKIVLDAPVKFVAFSSAPAAKSAATLLVDHSVHFWDKLDQPSASIVHLGSIQLPKAHAVRQIAWVDEHTLLSLEHDASHGTDRLVAYSFDLSASPPGISKSIDIPHPDRHAKFIRLYHNATSGIIALQTSVGKVFQVSNYDGECERNKLFVNGKILSLECTSFFVHNEFLIITTLSHTARFLPLNQTLQSRSTGTFSETGPNIGYDEHHRRVERGSQIVIAGMNDLNLILQMPRGNLETICPRALVLSTVRHAIDKHDYKKAFMTCRKHRIDMNLLVDHNPQEFLSNAHDFVKQLADVDYLNLFISSLRNEDVTETMYRPTSKSTAAPASASPPRDVTNKVNELCTLIATVLNQIDPIQYLQSVLTSDAKKSPPDLETAMLRIVTIKQQSESHAALIESALQYLIFLVDVDHLYRVALGMYDFPLALMVAQYSQMDPREYLPFLVELQKLPRYYMRFKIDDGLGRHVSAVKNLRLAGDEHFAMLVEYVKKHSLYPTALALYPKDSDHHKTLLVEFANFHLTNSRYDEAGLLYEMAGDLTQALSAYTSAGLWQQAYTIALTLDYSKEQLAEMAEALVEVLILNRDYRSIARIYLDIVGNVERAVTMLSEGFYWSEAIMTAAMHRASHLKQTIVKPALLKAAAMIADELKETPVTFENQRQRLKQVREDKIKKQQQIVSGESTHDDRLDDIDMFSDTASMATTRITGSVTTGRSSMMSSRTGRTSKQRRKQARKRAAGKEPAYEDEFLLNSLANIVNRSRTLSTDLQPLTKTLMVFGETDTATHLQTSFRNLLNIISTGYNDIFEAKWSEPIADNSFLAQLGRDPLNPQNNDDLDLSEFALLRLATIQKPAMVTEKWWTESLE
eukprot:jgi/Hompol1/2961/HPOL_003082-RA